MNAELIVSTQMYYLLLSFLASLNDCDFFQFLENSNTFYSHIYSQCSLPENTYQNNFLKWRFDPYFISVLQILQSLLITFSMRWIWFSLPDKKLCDKIPAWLSRFITDCLHRWAQWGCLPATFFCGIALLCNAPISMLVSKSVFSLKLTLLPSSLLTDSSWAS